MHSYGYHAGKSAEPAHYHQRIYTNGDGINDVWTVPDLADYAQATVQIFERYSRIVFCTTGYAKPWDGKLYGSPLPSGTYYYIINTKTDFVKPFSGAVTILR